MPKLKELTGKARDPGEKNFDSTDTLVLDSHGKTVSEPSKIRKDLVESLLLLLQNTVEDKVNGIPYLTKVDLLENHLYDLVMYADSLRKAASEIQENYPTPDRDEPLVNLRDLCDVVEEGANRVRQYVESIRGFGNDLNNIKSEIYTEIQSLFSEV